MTAEQPTSKSARILYVPIGVVSSVVGGLVAGQVFKQVWKHATPTRTSDAPKPLESEYSWPEVLAAAAAQGAVFATVKAVIQRGGAKGFQRWTGEWPGD
jgi:hypothetical protein